MSKNLVPTDDPLVMWHPTKKRYYIRKFDHADAKRRYESGEKAIDLAREYGVDVNAIRTAVIPGEYEKQLMNVAKHRAAVCEECGGYACALVGGKRTHNHDGRILCQTCRNRTRRTNVSVVDGEVVALKCTTCNEWWEPEMFARGARYRDLREGGYATQCRPCATAARTAYRERNKVPCEGGCGRMVECSGRNPGVNPDRPPLCAACWHERRRR